MGKTKTKTKAKPKPKPAATSGAKPRAWRHAIGAELANLERWGRELTERDRLAGIAALVATASRWSGADRTKVIADLRAACGAS